MNQGALTQCSGIDRPPERADDERVLDAELVNNDGREDAACREKSGQCRRGRRRGKGSAPKPIRTKTSEFDSETCVAEAT